MDRRGFTLIEVMVAVAIAGVIAAMGVAFWRSMGKNASVGDAAMGIAAELNGARVMAMREGVPVGALVMDTLNNDPATCMADRRNCLRICVVRDPVAGWSAVTSNPGAAALGDCTINTNGVRFQLADVRAPPAPFAALAPNDPALVPVVAGRRVLALRFDPNGTVAPMPTAAGAPLANGVAVLISSDAQNAAVTKGVVVAFPYGLVRTYSY